MLPLPESSEKWKGKIYEVHSSNDNTDKFDLEDNLFVFMGMCSQELPPSVGETPTNEFQGRIIFMSLFNDIEWEEKECSDCISNACKTV